MGNSAGYCSSLSFKVIMQILFMLHTLLMFRVKLRVERLYLISEHKMLLMNALSGAAHTLECKMTLLLFQLIQVK